ncbi:hypothetical protein V2U99_00590 [Klebsiella variicola]
MTREAVAKLDQLPPNPSRALTTSNAFLSLAQRTDLPQAERCQAPVMPEYAPWAV